MSKRHLSYFCIENFKCFETFEIEQIGQFNLILGDNNVGKSSLLEALTFDEVNFDNTVSNFYRILERKNIMVNNRMSETGESPENYFAYFTHKKRFEKGLSFKFAYDKEEIQNLQINADFDFTLFEKYPDEFNAQFGNKTAEELNNRILWFFQTNKNSKFVLERAFSQFRRPNKTLPLVFFAQTYEEDLIQFFSDFVQPNKESFIEALRLFIPTIKDIEIVSKNYKNTLYIREMDNAFMPISMFGDGVNRLVRILLLLQTAKGKRLMIDEIDAGLHFQRFHNFWRVILRAANLLEVQIFATTHNIECLQAFKEVLGEEKMQEYQEEARCFELLALPNNKIKAYNYSFAQFSTMIESRTNMRGGQY